MRDPKRLITILDLIVRLWLEWSQDLRFFQFISILQSRLITLHGDMDFFSLEDDDLIIYLRELLYQEGSDKNK